MSRRKARQQFSLPELDDAMGDIEFRSDEQFVDEIPAAYKPIGQIMEDSRDLVKVNLTLRQIVNVKGE